MLRFTLPALTVFIMMTADPSAAAALSDSTGNSGRRTPRAENNPIKYRLLTEPSSNRKRVNQMCLKFLSVIPNADLIPKTEERVVYRLVTGRFADRAAAAKTIGGLRHVNESPFIVRQDDFHFVIAGSQLTDELARAEQKRLASKKIETIIVETRVPLKQWQMKSTEFFTIRDAVKKANELALKGVVTILEPVGDK